MMRKEKTLSVSAVVLFSTLLLLVFTSGQAIGNGYDPNLICNSTGCTAGFANTAHSVDALFIVTGSLAAGAVTPAKMASSCEDNQVLKFTGAAWTCAVYNTGTVTSLAAGTGLSGGTIITASTLDVNFAGSGSANTAARSDHNHQGTYQQFNPLQVALLRWYDANTVTTFAVGSAPFGIAFDGANIWVTNRGGDNVTKLDAATGAWVGTHAVGTNPFGVAFDGANIWVTNRLSDNVTKLTAATGATVGTYAVGSHPQAVAFDGANIWVANSGSSNVMKLNTATGEAVGTYAVGSSPDGIAFDGANIWVANYDNGNVMKLNAATGAWVGTYPVGTSPIGVAFDGANIWVANRDSSNVTKLNAATGATVGTYPVGTSPIGIAFDGANIWVANSGSSNVMKL